MTVKTSGLVMPMDRTQNPIDNPDPRDLLPGDPPSNMSGPGPGPLSDLPSLDWSQLVSGTRLPDGDVITASVTSIGGNQLQLALQTAPSVTWWKGIEVFDQNNEKIAFTYTQDRNHGPACITVDMTGVDSQGSRVEFQKAKLFGVHTGMYQMRVCDLNNAVTHGVRVTFKWTADKF